MDNGMQNMLDMYLFETNTLIDELDGILLEAEKNDGTFNEDDINEIFRIMHTVKGSSAMMQFNSLSTISHQVEDLFFFIREHGGHQEFGHDLFNLLFSASDFIKAQTEKIVNSEPISEDIGELADAISSLLTNFKHDQEAIDELQENPQPEAAGADIMAYESSKLQKSSEHDATTATGNFGLRVFFDEDCGMENLRAYMMITSVQNVCEDFSFYPENVETDSSTTAYILEHGFTMYFRNRADLDSAIPVVKSSLNIRTYEELSPGSSEPPAVSASEAAAADVASSSSETGQKPAPAKKQPAPPKAESQEDSKANTHIAGGKQNLINVNLSKLDKLMAIVGEIVITESMVTSNPDLKGLKLDNFTKSARQLRKLTDDLQDTVMSIRMVPVSGVFQKMNRIVRDMSQKLGKPARLVTVGADTEVDKTIVDSIGDPIMHIVRNSMDHGLEETAQDRIASGKSAEGTITLSAHHTGSEVIISIQDDGAGVDVQKVLAKARDNNMLTKPENEYSQKDILQFLLMPGFSTNEEVTEFSGRGVGMDVVKKNIEKVGGIVTMTTEEGQGTCTTFKIPLTLAIVDGMEIAVGNTIFTVPIHNIRQSFKVSQSDVVYDAKKGEMIRRRDHFYPLMRLHEFYDLNTEITNLEDGIILWVEADDKSYCLFVDDLLGEQQVVVKPLPPYLYSFNIKNSGIAGCTILGDGNISIILDIQNLYESAIRGI